MNEPKQEFKLWPVSTPATLRNRKTEIEIELNHVRYEAALAERARLYQIYHTLGIIHLVKALQDTK